MNKYQKRVTPLVQALAVAFGSLVVGEVALAQQTAATDQRVEVTGSRLRRAETEGALPVTVISREQIESSGQTSVAELMRETTFSSFGNFKPQSGSSGQALADIDLRGLGSNRTLVLMDGRRISKAPFSGQSQDLNSIPLAAVERIEILSDGASAIYGSDAIAGVVNIITRKKFEGVEVHTYYGEYSRGGETTEASLTLGGGGERFNGVFSASYYEQKRISAADWEQSAWPEPGAGLAAGSSAIPQGRFTFCDPARPVGSYGSCTPSEEFFYDLALDDGTTTPVWNPADPSAGTYHDFTGADRFNFAPYNLLLTPSKRKSMFGSVNVDLTDNVRLHAKMLYNNRQSANQAAPEPIFVGP